MGIYVRGKRGPMKQCTEILVQGSYVAEISYGSLSNCNWAPGACTLQQG